MGYNSVLFISDTHNPYHHKDTYEFLKQLKKKYKPDLVVHMGDELDWHTISFHDSDPDLSYSPSSELEAAIDTIHDDIASLFPKVQVCNSNHGSLVYRRAFAHGLPKSVIKPWKEVLELPKWDWHDKIIVPTSSGKWLAVHGKSAVSGKLSRASNMHTIEGHFHTKFEITTWKGTFGPRKFAVKTGCMVDNDSLAFAYNKANVEDVLLGHTVVINGLPKLLPMIMNDENRWTGVVP